MIELYSTLHEEYNDVPEDLEVKELSAKAQDEIDKAEKARKKKGRGRSKKKSGRRSRKL